MSTFTLCEIITLAYILLFKFTFCSHNGLIINDSHKKSEILPNLEITTLQLKMGNIGDW